MRRRTHLLLGVVLVAACGGGDDVGEATPTEVGSAFAESTTTVAAATTTAATAPSTSTAAAEATPSGPVVANRSQRETNGWRLTLVVADTTTFGPDEPITLELTYENVSTETQHTDAAQDLHFGLATESGEFVWTDQSCGGAQGDVAGESHAALAFGPGEHGRFVARYPVPVTSERSGAEACRVEPGRYAVIGQLDWCPPSALEEVSYADKRDYVCRPDAIMPLLSDPVMVEITA